MVKSNKRTCSSIALEIAYRKKLMKLITSMHRSVKWWLSSRYRSNEDTIVGMDSATGDLDKELKKLFRQWRNQFEDASNEIASWFINKSKVHADINLKSLLKDAGFTINHKLSRKQRDKLNSLLVGNVNLIRSIPERYFTDLTAITMESVARGRDLAYLNEEILKRYNITSKRAELIARDQNNKATAVITHMRYEDVGIEKALWKHNSGSKEPRVSHLSANDKPYNINEGMLIDGEYIFPGEAINCNCTSMPLIKGLDYE